MEREWARCGVMRKLIRDLGKAALLVWSGRSVSGHQEYPSMPRRLTCMSKLSSRENCGFTFAVSEAAKTV